jgi:polysaccharide biosynthesis/export protein
MEQTRQQPVDTARILRRLAGVAGAALFVLAGCVIPPAGQQGSSLPHGGTAEAAKAPHLNGLPHEYIIGPGDTIEVLVWRNEALSRSVIVRPDGKISLPLINDILAAGRTPMELKEEIARELKRYKEVPEVSVIVTETKSQVVYLLGQVVNPGPYPLSPKATVLQVIAQAGGFTPYADRNNIVVIRPANGKTQEQRITVSYRSILAGRSTKGNIALHAGDTIIVP